MEEGAEARAVLEVHVHNLEGHEVGTSIAKEQFSGEAAQAGLDADGSGRGVKKVMLTETDTTAEAELADRGGGIAIGSADFGGEAAANARSGIVALAHAGSFIVGVRRNGLEVG